jgi:hypothetical protein
VTGWALPARFRISSQIGSTRIGGGLAGLQLTGVRAAFASTAAPLLPAGFLVRRVIHIWGRHRCAAISHHLAPHAHPSPLQTPRE